MSSCRWYLRANSFPTQSGRAPMPSPPRGPVPTSTRRRTRSGRARATSWATRPPIEWPTTSIVVSPSAKIKVIASRAIASPMVSGTIPLDDATPVLLNKMTSRSPHEGVAQGRVVVIHGAHEVLVEHQRRTAGPPETAVGETYPAALGVLGGRSVMRERSHDASVPPGRVPRVSVTRLHFYPGRSGSARCSHVTDTSHRSRFAGWQ